MPAILALLLLGLLATAPLALADPDKDERGNGPDKVVIEVDDDDDDVQESRRGGWGTTTTLFVILGAVVLGLLIVALSRGGRW